MWVEEVKNRIPLHKAVKKMNDKIGTTHTPTRIRQMSYLNHRGQRITRDMRVYMSGVVLAHALESCGFDIKCLKKIDVKKLIEMLQ